MGRQQLLSDQFQESTIVQRCHFEASTEQPVRYKSRTRTSLNEVAGICAVLVCGIRRSGAQSHSIHRFEVCVPAALAGRWLARQSCQPRMKASAEACFEYSTHTVTRDSQRLILLQTSSFSRCYESRRSRGHHGVRNSAVLGWMAVSQQRAFR